MRLALCCGVALAMTGVAATAQTPGTTTDVPVPVATAAPSPAADATAPDRAGYSYDYAVDDGRYGDVYVSFDAYKPFGPRTRLRPFADAAVVRDTRSGGGNVPLILNDNYVLGAAGVQYTDGSGLRVFAQAGATAKFGPIAAQPSGGDLRGGVQFYRDIGTPYAERRGYGNVYASATYYSRYSDWVLYVQSETIQKISGVKRPLEAFVRPVVTLDTYSHYYSNLAEATLGLRYHPLGVTGPVVSLEGVAGWYLRGAIRPAGQGVFYTDVRPTLSYGFAL